MREHAPTIFYHPEGYSTRGNKLMGRNAAGESFLNGFLKYANPSKRLWVQVHDQSDATPFVELAKKLGCRQPISLVDYSSIRSNQKPGLLYYPGPDICDQARYRSFHGDALWSICGITHTTSSKRAMDSVSNWLTEPVQSWDAVICTSQAVKSNVEFILEQREEELRHRLGATKAIAPALPVIPLGIDTNRFSFSEQEKVSARQILNIPGDSVAVLYAGRLSFHAKANPIQMYSCLEKAASITDEKIYLIESGWYANDSIESAFEEAASRLCPSITRIFVDGRNNTSNMAAWAAADIFCSLSDNIQETFGIVPLEAMAAGIPQIVSDWDGYKDTVRDGIDGFRIPTINPRPGLGGDLAYRHATDLDSYDMYCGNNSNLVSVNEASLTNSFIELIKSPELRMKLGQEARANAKSNYDWQAIIPKYEDLWSEMSETRKANTNNKTATLVKEKAKKVWPARLDPTHSFSQYPSKPLDENTVLTIWTDDTDLAFEKYKTHRQLRIMNYTPHILPSEQEVKQVISNAARSYPRPGIAADLLFKIPEGRKPFVLRSLVWLCKIGILEFR